VSGPPGNDLHRGGDTGSDAPRSDMATAGTAYPNAAHSDKNATTPNIANGSVRVEIFDQVYNLRGSDAEYIVKLAEYVDGKMRAVSEQTATVDSVRLAVLAALNIADEYHLLKRRLEQPSPEEQRRASKLSSALDEILEDGRRTG